MKKLTLLFILIILCSLKSARSQSYEYEVENVKKQYLSGDFDVWKYQKLGTLWKNIIDESGGYPVLPINMETRDVYYLYYFDFDSLNKNIIYNRILEWLTLRYDDLDAVLDYQDYALGKLIVKARNPINRIGNATRMYYVCTYRFTILETKLRLEIFKLSIDNEYYAYTIGETVFYNHVINIPIGSYYPVTISNDKAWRDRLRTLKTTHEAIEKSVTELSAFICAYEKDYDF